MSSPGRAIRILIADDHSIFRDGLKLMVLKLAAEGLEISGEARSGTGVLESFLSHRPDIVLMDIQMPDMDGIEATRNIVRHFPETGIIALSSSDSIGHIREMIRAGARGYLLKNVEAPELLQAVRTVHSGGTYYTPSMALHLHIPQVKEPKLEALSLREKQVIYQLCQGLTNKEIATALGISRRTVEGHREKIMAKIQARHSSDIVTYAVKHRIFMV